MHQPPSAKEDVTKVKEEVGGDGDIELPDSASSGNSQIVENDPKLEEMTGGSSVSCHSTVLLDNNSIAAMVSCWDKLKSQDCQGLMHTILAIQGLLSILSAFLKNVHQWSA